MASPSERTPGADLAQALTVLGSPVRLQILRQLRTPKTVTELDVRVRPARGEDRDRPRTLARQTVKEHLDKLVDRGIVRTREGQREHRTVTEYVIDHQRLYALGDEVRELALLRPTAEPSAGTMATTGPEPASAPTEPTLVVVKGLDAGRRFPLLAPGGRARSWRLGRRRDLDVPLDYDAYVSGEHAVIRFDGERYEIEDLDSRNGTRLDFEPLEPGRPEPLVNGSVIGVGRSRLVVKLPEKT